jgi:enoyl-CoA hydratase
MDYSRYKELKVRRLEPGILELVMGEEGTKLSTATAGMHRELAEIWLDVDRDPETRVAILRGAGRGFSGGGDLGMVQEITQDFATRARVWREARDIVYNVINCSKMIVSAMHGPAVGAGLVVGCSPTYRLRRKRAHHRRPYAARRRCG